MFYKFAKAIFFPIIYLLFWPKVEGIENIPQDGKVIIYSNHSSNFDPIVLGVLMPRKIHFMAKEELFKIPIFGAAIKGLGAFPIRRGRVDISAIKNSLKILKDGKVLGMFPEGTRSESGEIQDFARGIASIALRAESCVIPVAIIDGYRCFRPITVRAGQPIYYSEYHGKKTHGKELDEIAKDMENALRELVY